MTQALTIRIGDALGILRELPSESFHCCVTSPPYWGLRDYGVEGQLGLESTPQEYVAKMVEVFREMRRVLRGDGTLWLNLGDSYAATGGHTKADSTGFLATMPDQAAQRNRGTTKVPEGFKAKDLIGIPWRVAFELQADGWWLRQDIIWHKPNPMPESVTDRCTKAHEYIFLLSKSERYYFDQSAITETKECWRKRGAGRSKHNADRNDNGDMAHFANADIERGTRNKRSVWTVPTAPFKGSHFATFPPDLIKPCILAGCPIGGTVLDPFAGSGTVGQVALDNARFAFLIELNPAYQTFIEQRCPV